jgi:hypothetical protein
MDDVAVIRSDSPTEAQARERAVAELARRQHGVVAKRQLIALGVGEGAIKHRLGVGRLHRVHAGVYALGHLALGADGNRMAAVLAAGPDARLSHRDAAALWDLRATAHTRIDVSVPRSGLRSRQGLNVHCTAPWHPDDCANRRGIPVTSVARTLLDVAEVVSRRAFRHIFEEAERLRLVDVRAIQAVVARGHGRRGGSWRASWLTPSGHGSVSWSSSMAADTTTRGPPSSVIGSATQRSRSPAIASCESPGSVSTASRTSSARRSVRC